MSNLTDGTWVDVPDVSLSPRMPLIMVVTNTVGGGVGIVHVGNLSLSTEKVDLAEHYEKISDLPLWLQEKLAVLSMLPSTTDRRVSFVGAPSVEGIGTRTAKHTFFVELTGISDPDKDGG